MPSNLFRMLLLWYLSLLLRLLLHLHYLLPALGHSQPWPLPLLLLLLAMARTLPRHNRLKWAQPGKSCLDFWTWGLLHAYCPPVRTAILRQFYCTCRGWNVLL
jgi:hypothetical protein